MTTKLTTEERTACYEQAQDHLIAVLKGERSPYEGDDERVYRILADLVSTRVLQSEGLRLDQYAMLFAKQAEYAKEILCDYYVAQAALVKANLVVAQLDDVAPDDLYEGLDAAGQLELAGHIADQGAEAGFAADIIEDAKERIARAES